eukprot:SAG22_NODE_16598_length_322_cov_0.695067_1_plen_60_part_10
MCAVSVCVETRGENQQRQTISARQSITRPPARPSIIVGQAGVSMRETVTTRVPAAHRERV